ncbi:FtsQ-type POTRA domain-containing protein [bacterium]|nr:FtsQ-type POTRA domain-containing protein [bacterium]
MSQHVDKDTFRKLRKRSLLVLFGIAQLVFFLSDVFAVSYVKVEGNVYVPSESIVAASSLHAAFASSRRSDCYYWSYWLQGIPQRVKEMPELSGASLHYLPSGVVVIKVQELPAAIQVYTNNASQPWAAVTQNGIILGPVKDAKCKLPKLKLVRGVPVHGAMSAEPIAYCLEADKAFREAFGANMLAYRLDGTMSLTAEVKFKGKPIVVKIGDLRDLPSKRKRALALMDLWRQKSEPIKSIDVRYKNPVVSLLNPPSPPASTDEHYQDYAYPKPAIAPAQNISALDYYHHDGSAKKGDKGTAKQAKVAGGQEAAAAEQDAAGAEADNAAVPESIENMPVPVPEPEQDGQWQ